MVDNFTHQFTHAATILTSFSLRNESSEDLVKRVSNDATLLHNFTKLLSTDYSVDFVRALLLNEQFIITLKNIRGDF